MLSRLFLVLAALFAVPAQAQLPQRGQNAIVPELIAEGPAAPGGEIELAILMRTKPGWHGYWLNPGDAGLPMSVEWTLPPRLVGRADALSGAGQTARRRDRQLRL